MNIRYPIYEGVYRILTFGPHHTDRGHLPQLHGRGDALSVPFFVRQLLYTSFLLTSEKIM